MICAALGARACNSAAFVATAGNGKEFLGESATPFDDGFVDREITFKLTYASLSWDIGRTLLGSG